MWSSSHDIYKWHTDQRRQAARPRAASYSGSVAPSNPAFEHIHEPGGFRRNYVHLQSNGQTLYERRTTNNFIEFLYIFGQFVSHGDLTSRNSSDKKPRQAKTSRKMTIEWTMRKSLNHLNQVQYQVFRMSRSRYSNKQDPGRGVERRPSVLGEMHQSPKQSLRCALI